MLDLSVFFSVPTLLDISAEMHTHDSLPICSKRDDQQDIAVPFFIDPGISIRIDSAHCKLMQRIMSCGDLLRSVLVGVLWYNYQDRKLGNCSLIP